MTTTTHGRSLAAQKWLQASYRNGQLQKAEFDTSFADSASGEQYHEHGFKMGNQPWQMEYDEAPMMPRRLMPPTASAARGPTIEDVTEMMPYRRRRSSSRKHRHRRPSFRSVRLPRSHHL